jgi:hypothetical protein
LFRLYTDELEINARRSGWLARLADCSPMYN